MHRCEAEEDGTHMATRRPLLSFAILQWNERRSEGSGSKRQLVTTKMSRRRLGKSPAVNGGEGGTRLIELPGSPSIHCCGQRAPVCGVYRRRRLVLVRRELNFR